MHSENGRKQNTEVTSCLFRRPVAMVLIVVNYAKCFQVVQMLFCTQMSLSGRDVRKYDYAVDSAMQGDILGHQLSMSALPLSDLAIYMIEIVI